MQLLALTRRAFTLIEMVIVLAVMGIALAVVAPTMILPPRTTNIGSVIADARTVALRRSEQVILVIAADGKWSVNAARLTASPILYGRLETKNGVSLRMDISPLGLCTVNESSSPGLLALNPFTCVFTDSSALAR